MLNRTLTILALLLALVIAVPAMADDWVAIKLRGDVQQLVAGEWLKLSRGDVVPDDRVVRTLANGRVDFQRDAEVISLGGTTQVQIHDRTGKRFTTVTQYFGTVEVEAEVENVRHFAVETPYLAAVVKGTHFIVKSGKAGSSVKVTRGRVEVTELKSGAHVLVPAGQTAKVAATGGIDLSGKGAKSNQIVGATGTVIGVGSVSAAVAGVGATATVGGDGVAVGVTTPVGVGVDAGVSGDGVTVGVDVGDTGVGVDVGSDGVSVNVGGIGVNIGGGGGLGGLL